VAVIAGRNSADEWFATDFFDDLKRGAVASQLLCYEARFLVEAAPKRVTVAVSNDSDVSGDYLLASAAVAPWPPVFDDSGAATLEKEGLSQATVALLSRRRSSTPVDALEMDVLPPTQCARLEYRKENNHPCMLTATLRVLPGSPARDVVAVGSLVDGRGVLRYGLRPQGSSTVLVPIRPSSGSDGGPAGAIDASDAVTVSEQELDEALAPVVSRIAKGITPAQLVHEFARLPPAMRQPIENLEAHHTTRAQ